MSSQINRVWKDLLSDLSNGLEAAIKELEERDVERVPGARQALLQRLNTMRTHFPSSDGKILKEAIDEKIQEAFLPSSPDFASAFAKIDDSRTHEQDFIINELVNGFVTSKAKAIASGSQIPVIDRMVEAFSSRNDFHIVDHQFFAMFGNPHKPRSYVKKQLEDIIKLFGLVSKELVVEKDIRKSERKVYTFYTFPDEIIAILEKKYLKFDEELGYAVVTEEFDRTVFISMFLANIAVNRSELKKIGGDFTVNGISAIFALILLLSFMPKLTVEETNPILRDPGFDETNMSVIPKSWMMKQVLGQLFEPLIKIIAFRLGGGLWLSKIKDSEVHRKLHEQIRFLLKDVNRWILGELVRVEIPIFVEIANIFAEVSLDTGFEEKE